MQQSPVVLDLCLRKPQSINHMNSVKSSFSKSSVFKIFSVHKKKHQKPAFLASSGLNSVVEKFRRKFITSVYGFCLDNVLLRNEV